MAKKIDTLSGTTGRKKSIFDIMKSVDKSFEIMSESKTAKIKEYIHTGNYILNAAMTGSIFKGVPSGRVTCFAGQPGTGKTYLALSICREAIKQDYDPVYFDSEGALSDEIVEGLGINLEHFGWERVTTISEVSSKIAATLKIYNETPEEDRRKCLFVIDSIGNLTSDKELTDTIGANRKKDMTKQQEIKALFRTNVTALAKANCPLIVISHVYQTQDLFSRTVISGGSGIGFSSSLTMLLSTSKMEDTDSDKIIASRPGEFVKTGVVVTAKAEKSRFTIPHKVQFSIPYFKKPNPYVGLHEYLDWDNFGVINGHIIDEKAYNKLSDNDKIKCYEMKDVNGNVCYAVEKSTSKKIVVRHLGREISKREFFTDAVFTDEMLHKIDEIAIRPNFEFSAQSSDQDIEELFDIEDSE